MGSNCLHKFQFVLDFPWCLSGFLLNSLLCWLTVTLAWYLGDKAATFLRLFFFQFPFVSLVSFLSMIIQPFPSWLLCLLFTQKPPDYCVRSNPYNKSPFHATHICYAFLDLTLNVIGAGSGVLPLQKPKLDVFGFGIKQWAFHFLENLTSLILSSCFHLQSLSFHWINHIYSISVFPEIVKLLQTLSPQTAFSWMSLITHLPNIISLLWLTVHPNYPSKCHQEPECLLIQWCLFCSVLSGLSPIELSNHPSVFVTLTMSSFLKYPL